ncbi:hypothetical protein BCR43DRAFT_482930 [Syncephalastrum racemosum]|uniref:Uncharacterized protein n=1 Tax=Syncephalastrum racemosum TaxID=13706 RepID=A0A1X2HUF0_SYNRA|nr:hypothetical protein BCR43DRAFT_482930 [Syncephalastrum racemosum]
MYRHGEINQKGYLHVCGSRASPFKELTCISFMHKSLEAIGIGVTGSHHKYWTMGRSMHSYRHLYAIAGDYRSVIIDWSISGVAHMIFQSGFVFRSPSLDEMVSLSKVSVIHSGRCYNA